MIDHLNFLMNIIAKGCCARVFMTWHGSTAILGFIDEMAGQPNW